MVNPKSNQINDKKVKTDAKDIIGKIQQNIVEMKRNWNHLQTYNVSPKGYKCPFDLKAIYKQNIKLEAEIIKRKLAQAAINMGFTSISQIPNNSSLPTIYTLNQLKSRKDNLRKLKYECAKGEITFYTKKKIDDEVKILDREISKCEIELEKFNKNSYVEI